MTDFVGHGTFVTGLIAALDGNGLGGKGVAGSTKLIAVRASRDGRFALSDLLRGIELSIRRGADVLNMSLAGKSFTQTQARRSRRRSSTTCCPVAASGNNARERQPARVPGRGRRRRARAAAASGCRWPRRSRTGASPSFSNHNAFVSLAAPGASADHCDFGVFSTLPATTIPAWNEGGCPQLFTGVGGAPLRLRRGHELRRADRLRARRTRVAGRAPARLRAGGGRAGRARPPARLERVHRRRRRRRHARRRGRPRVRRAGPASRARRAAAATACACGQALAATARWPATSSPAT